MKLTRARTMVALSALWVSVGVHAQACDEAGSRSRQDAADLVAQGGRLYDKWWTACGLAEPKTTHPSYPTTVGKQSGATTWRCKECHGWDYRGKDGAYSKGSHFTGIVGVSGYAGRSEADIVAVLKDDRHQFGAVLSDAALKSVSEFVSKGQIDAGNSIDAKTKKVSGNLALGKRSFEQQCMACHGVKGRAMNFSGSAAEPEYLGTLAVDNPWEMLHKIRNGHPNAVMDDARMQARYGDPDASRRSHMGMHMIQGRAMPAYRNTLTPAEQLHLMSFLQTLPVR